MPISACLRGSRIEAVGVDVGLAEPAGFEQRFGKEQGGTAGGVLFLVVMDLGHLDVVGFAEQGGELGQDVHDDVDAHAHVGGAEDEGRFGQGVEFGELFFGEAGGADDDGAACGRGGAGVHHAGLGSSEVDDDGPGELGRGGGDVAGSENAGGGVSGKAGFGFGAFDHGDEGKVVSFFDKTGDGSAHAAGRPHDDDGNCHRTAPE